MGGTAKDAEPGNDEHDDLPYDAEPERNDANGKWRKDWMEWQRQGGNKGGGKDGGKGLNPNNLK